MNAYEWFAVGAMLGVLVGWGVAVHADREAAREGHTYCDKCRRAGVL